MPAALVTGASSGIGEAFARLLAGRGHDVVLVARRRDRLDDLAATLAPSRVEVIEADLTELAGLAVVEARLRDASRPVDLLVNNAGFGTTGRFHELELDEEDREVRLNALAVVRLSHAVLPGLVARGRGGIINVASIAAFQPVPGNATYAATKAFVMSFSAALHEEYRGSGVNVLCVCPGSTDTEWHERAGYDKSRIPRFAHQPALDCAQEALAAYDRGRSVITTNWPNKAISFATQLVPRSLLGRITGMVMGRG